MSGSSQHLTLYQDRCDQCGACRSVCPSSALKIGAAFIYVDWRRCDGCLRCVETCDRNAIVSRLVPLRSSSVQSTVLPADVCKVVVGSRAEAKVVRKAAERAAKEKKNAKPPKKAAAPKPAPPSADIAMQSARVHLPFDREAPVSSSLPATVLPTARTLASRKPPAAKPARSFDLGGASVAWTLLDAVAVLGIMLLALVAKNSALALPQVALMPQLGKMVVRTVVLFAFYTAQIAAFGWLAGRHGLPAAEGFGLRSSSAASEPGRRSVLGSAGLVLALFAGCEIVSIGYGFGMEAVGIAQPQRLSGDLAGVFGSGPIGLVLAFGLVAIAAPFAEEIAFRAIVLPAVGGRWGMWMGIGVSALLYAAYHTNLWLFAPTAVLGVALGWLTWTRRSLWPAIALHVLLNTTAVAAAFATAR